MAIKSTCIKYENVDITINYKKIKTMRLKAFITDEIHLNVPFGTNLDEITHFLELNTNWLKNRAKKIDDNEFIFFAKKYKIKRGDFIKFTNSEVIAPNLDELRKFCIEFFRIFVSYEILKFSKILGVSINKLRIKKMRSRFGSCNYLKKYINLNQELIKYDKEFIRYVIIHELMHLKIPNHSKEFYNEIKKIMPNFKDIIKINLYFRS